MSTLKKLYFNCTDTEMRCEKFMLSTCLAILEHFHLQNIEPFYKLTTTFFAFLSSTGKRTWKSCWDWAVCLWEICLVWPTFAKDSKRSGPLHCKAQKENIPDQVSGTKKKTQQKESAMGEDGAGSKTRGAEQQRRVEQVEFAILELKICRTEITLTNCRVRQIICCIY